MPGAAPKASADAQPEGVDVTRLDDVVVTANKRKESARSVAGAVTAIDSKRLEETGASNFGDYLSQSPGVNFNSGVSGYSVITIRGVSSDTVPGTAQTAVGVYYDDLPLTDPGGPVSVPDIDAFDADRIEVLRGPQGALYGSASLGGALNYVPKAPNLFANEFATQLTGSLATNSVLGGSAKAMVNVPLFAGTSIAENGLGVRAVGYYNRTPGYIDNVGTGVERSNESTTSGGRVTIGWGLTPSTTIRLSGLTQTTRIEDLGYVDESLGDLKKSTINPEPSDNELKLASLRFESEQDFGSWAFIGGYQKKHSYLFYEGANALGAQALGQSLPLVQEAAIDGYSGEVRFVSPSDGAVTWLAGLSYANRNQTAQALLDAATLQDARSIGNQLGALLDLPGLGNLLENATILDVNVDIQAPEKAAFFDVKWNITDDLKLDAGGRYYQNEVDTASVTRGALALTNGSLVYRTRRIEQASGFNPKVSLSWQADDDIMLYGLYSRGYRLGGANVVPSSALIQTKATYGSDEVRNYEAGMRTSWWHGQMTLDVSAFMIDWADIPLVILDRTGLFKYLDNAGDARIRGVETSIAARPFDFLTYRGAITWTDARLASDFDPNNGRPPAKAGDRLPGSPEWTISNALTGMWYWGDKTPTLTLLHRYESSSSTNLSYQDVLKGNFTTFDARAGLKWGAVGITAFGKNLFDVRGVTASNNLAQNNGDTLTLKYLCPPRTFGLELSYSFAQE